MKKINFNKNVRVYCPPNLRDIEDKNDYLIVNYGITSTYHINLFKSLWAKFDSTVKAVGRDEKSTKKAEHEKVGGAVSVFDIKLIFEYPSQNPTIIDLNIPNPFTSLYSNKTGELLVSSGPQIYAFKNGKVSRVLKNKLFNGIHGMSLTKRGILVCSTSIDTIVEVDIKNPSNVYWYWCAYEHGLNISTRGEIRSFDIDKNYSKLGTIGSSHHTTHVNSVLDCGDFVLATLFHQDQLIKIDKKTKEHTILYSDLTNPHSIRKTPTGYIISDTRGARVIYFDKKFKVIKILREKYFDWIQDALVHKKHTFVSNDNRGRVDIFDENGKLFRQISWNPEDRITSSLSLIKGRDLKNVFLQ